MARSETFEAKVYLNQKEAQAAMAELEAQIVDTGAALKKFNEEKNIKKSIEAEQHLKRLCKQYEEAKHGVENYRKALDNLNGQSLNELIRMQKALKRELDRTKPDTEEWKRMSKEYQQVTERIGNLRNAQKGVVTEGRKSTGAFRDFFNKVNDYYGGLLVHAKAAKAAFQAIIGVTKQVINASQTMGDKWNNGMAAMKTTTEAFFFSLSTGDWSAFENGISAVLAKARQLAETMDLLGSYNIAEGYMQSKYLTDYQSNITTATDTEATDEERRAALAAAKADLDAYNQFLKGESEATYKALQEEFDVYLNKTFESQEEFDQFFDKLFREATTGANAAVNEATAFMEEQFRKYNSEYKVIGDQIVYTYETTEARAMATADAVRKYGQETVDLVRAANLNDEKHKALIETYSKYRNSVNLLEQREKQYNRTRDRVIKQIGEQGDTIEEVMAFIDEWVEQEKQAAKERYEANKASFDSIKDAAHEYADEMAQIEAEGEARREAARAKAEEERRKAEEKARQERQAAADKAYQAAMKRVEKQESAQKLVWKNQYAAGLIDKQTYEAQIAVVEEDFLKQKMATAERYGKDTDQYMSQLLDRQIAAMEKANQAVNDEIDALLKQQQDWEAENLKEFEAYQKELEEKAKKMAEAAEKVKASLMSPSETRDAEKAAELAQLEELHDAKLLSEEQYEKAVKQLRKKYADEDLKEKLANVSKYIEKTNELFSEASNFVSQLKEYETQKLEAEYQAQLTAAGDNAEEREAIENEYEEKQLELKKKYADTEMAVNIAKTIASGAVAAIKAYAEGGPFAGPILAALIAATTAAEVATIVAQRNAIKNTSVSTSSTSGGTSPTVVTPTGYSSGGYTDRAASDSKPVGIVHANEWVAPAPMVRRNPVLFADLEQYRKTGFSSLGRSAGFAQGGFTGNGTAPASDTAMQKMLSAIERLEANTAANTAALNRLVDEGVPAYEVYDQHQSFETQRKRFKNATRR